MSKKQKCDEAWTDDQLIWACRYQRGVLFERLMDIATSTPPSHVTIAAAKLLLEKAACETERERDPLYWIEKMHAGMDYSSDAVDDGRDEC